MRPAAGASLLLLLSSALLADGFAGSSGAPQSWAAGGRPCARGGAALRQAEPAGSGGPGALFPVLGRIAGGVWEGEMRYAGAALEPAPFVLSGTTRCELVGRRCTLESSVTFPNGKTRRVAMRGEQAGEGGSSFRLDPVVAGGPIYMRLAELAPDTVLLQEFNKTDDRVVLTASLSVVRGGGELVQVAHEAADEPGAPAKGYQVWRMRRQGAP